MPRMKLIGILNRRQTNYLKKEDDSLHPIELIELMKASGILLVILSVSFILKGKWRKKNLSNW
jgi:hypothetical protein